MNRGIRLSQSLNCKIIVGVISALCVVVAVFFYFLYNFHKRQMIGSLKFATTNLSRVIQNSLETAMVINRPFFLQGMVEQAARQEGVEKIFIINKDGKIKFSSQDSLIGHILNPENPTCQICHRFAPQMRGQTVIYKAEESQQVLRNVTPIFNKPKCYSCHNPRDKINGVLIMDFSMGAINKALRSSLKYLLALSATMGLVVMAVITLLMNRLVLGKLSAFVQTTKSIAGGNLDETVHVSGDDELAHLADHFNLMTVSLRDSIGKIAAQKDYLDTLINSIDDGLIVIGRDFRIMLANKAYVSQFNQTGSPEIIGEHCYEVFPQASKYCSDACPARETFETGQLSKTIHVFYDDEAGDGKLSQSLKTLLKEGSRPRVRVGVARPHLSHESPSSDEAEQRMVGPPSRLARGFYSLLGLLGTVVKSRFF